MKTSEESTWLFHELGRCHLELGNHGEARDYGEKSLTAAGDAQDHLWQLNASVLVAQAESKCTWNIHAPMKRNYRFSRFIHVSMITWDYVQ